MKYRSLALAGALSCLSVASLAHGQTSIARFERQLQQIQRDTRLRIDPNVPVEQRTYYEFGGYFTFNFFAIDDIEQSTSVLAQYDLVGYGRVSIDGVHDFFIRARTSYRDFSEGDSFDGEDNKAIWPTVEQLYYRFDLGRYLAAYKEHQTNNNLTVQLGRQFVFWANGLVLAETLDGGLLTVTFGNLEAQFLAGYTSRDTVDIDASRPEFDSNTLRAFYGAQLSYTIGKHRPFIYGLIQRDYNDENQVLVISDSQTRFEYNSWYVGIGSNGALGDRLAYAVELVYEGGEALSNSFEPNTLTGIPQTEEDIEAWAFDLRFDYLVPDVRKTRLSAELIIASGDSDRLHSTNTFGGNTPGTNDNSFNAWGLLNTGLAFVPNPSNLMDIRLGASTFPMPSSRTFRKLQIGLDVHTLFKVQEDAPIDETTREDSRFLGVEPDLYLNWQITSDVTFALRYGVFFPGDAIVEDGNPRNFFFAGLTFAF